MYGGGSVIQSENPKRPFGRPSRKWKYTIKTDLKEIGCDGVERIELA
jgi:hypothetical protein